MQYPANLARFLLEERSGQHPVLYYYRGQALSRARFGADVRRLASGFQQRVRPGQCVVIALDDSPLLAASFLACVAVGAIPTILNPRLSLEQFSLIVEDCDAALCIVGTESARLLRAGAHVLSTRPVLRQRGTGAAADGDVKCDVEGAGDDLEAVLAAGSPQWDDFQPQPRDGVCYLQYTSGSTGKPKGVVHTVANTLGFCHAFAVGHLALSGRDVCYSVPKMFFGYGMGNSLFFPLLCGAAAILDDAWPTPDRVLANVRAHRPSVFFSVPAMYMALRPHARELAPQLRLAFSAGSPLPEGEFDAWRQAGVEILDGIGSTEVGHVFLAHAPGRARPGSTGRPVGGYECCLVDESGRLLAEPSRVGVLLVKGPGVAQGYWKLADRTEERFVEGWYRTGDLFSRSADGLFHYHGREDDKFKVKGRWVVPIGVEQAICAQFPQVHEAALVPSSRVHDVAKPTLFIASRPETGNDGDGDGGIVGQIAQWLKGRIEPHSLPRTIVRLDALPRNENGKMVKGALIEQAAALLAADTSLLPEPSGV